MKNVLDKLAIEITQISQYSDSLVQLEPMKHDNLYLYKKIIADKKETCKNVTELPDHFIHKNQKSIILLNGNLNHSYDIQELISEIKNNISRFSRLAIVIYNPYLSWIHSILKALGLREKPLPTTYITRTDLNNILALSGYEIIKTKSIGLFPWELFGIGTYIDKIIVNIPLIKWLSHSFLIIVRPIIPDNVKRSISIVVPARNEYGNIKNIVERIIKLDVENDVELIFVEGNSTDKTWLEIQRVAEEYKGKYKIKNLQQNGKGKGNAVEIGFENASGEILTILDADLTMPPELLPYFIDAFEKGHSDFINGTRLVYPMEGQAMRPLNWLGNIFFAKLLSWILEVHLGDSLCGTKLFHRNDYERIIRWWNDFGEHDPFGDFKLLFPASVLSLGIKDIPIRYRARTYGETNISRFSHGYMLLKITMIGLIRLKLGIKHEKKYEI